MVLNIIDDFIQRHGDPRVRDYYIGTSVWKPLTIVALYLLFIKKIGPEYMKNRSPYNMRKAIMAFDLFQVISNASMVVLILRNFPPLGENYCMDIEPDRLFLASYYYFLLKISDILDTVFFILKKNYRQVSFLHTYHHALMIIFSWVGWNIVPGGHSAMVGLVNCFVHTVMYSYYFLSAYNKEFKESIAIKKFVTQVQLVQFVWLLLFALYYLFRSCDFPKTFHVFGIIQASYFLYLFGTFYYNTYQCPKKNQ